MLSPQGFNPHFTKSMSHSRAIQNADFRTQTLTRSELSAFCILNSAFRVAFLSNYLSVGVVAKRPRALDGDLPGPLRSFLAAGLTHNGRFDGMQAQRPGRGGIHDHA